MNLISTEERIGLLKNLLADPDDFISAEILRLVDEENDADVCSGMRVEDPAVAKRNK
jgi:hypothetical protein